MQSIYLLSRNLLGSFQGPKKTKPPQTFEQRFEETFHKFYKGRIHTGTYDLKSKIGVGVVSTTRNDTGTISLPKIGSVFTAHFHAIQLPLESAEINSRRKFAFLAP